VTTSVTVTTTCDSWASVRSGGRWLIYEVTYGQPCKNRRKENEQVEELHFEGFDSKDQLQNVMRIQLWLC
jgi:hypothetical protein